MCEHFGSKSFEARGCSEACFHCKPLRQAACAGGAANSMVRFGKFRVESVKTGLKTATATKTL